MLNKVLNILVIALLAAGLLVSCIIGGCDVPVPTLSGSVAIERGGAQYVVIPADSEALISNEDYLFTGAPATMYMSESSYESVLGLAGVERASFQFYSQTLDASCCSATNPTRLIGIDATSDFVVSSLLPTGSDLKGMLEEGSIVIGSEVDGFKSGQGYVLDRQQTVSAVLAPTGTDLDHSILVGIDVARSISAAQAGYEHFWERYGEPETLISAILVDFDDQSRDTAVAKLQSLGGVTVLERSVIIEQSAHNLTSMLMVLAGAGIMMVLASFLQLFARFYSMVWDRRAEFALYEAIGASRGTLFKLVVIEAGILLGAGLVLGIVLSAALLPLLLTLSTSSGGSFAYIALGIGEVLLIDTAVVVVFVLLTLISVSASLKRITRIDASLAMRQTDIG